MVKKLFALASVTGLSGLVVSIAVAGCSSTTTVVDPGTDSATPVDSGKKETGPVTGDDDDDTTDAATTCPSSTPVDAADLPWKTAAATKVGACTQGQLDEFNKFLTDNPTTTNAQFIAHIKASTPTTCGACVVTDQGNATWGPLPVTTAGDLVTINIGACFAIVGKNDKCGQAIQNEFDCEFVACGDCTDDTAFNACRTKSQKGACKPYVSGIQTDCSGVPASVDDQCGSFFDSMRVQCVSAAPVDGGDGGDGGN